MSYRSTPTGHIGFRDFVPRVATKSTLIGVAIWHETVFEPIASAVEAANAWIDETGARILNVETVMCSYETDGTLFTTPIALFAGTTASSTRLVQVVRVWYELPTDR